MKYLYFSIKANKKSSFRPYRSRGKNALRSFVHYFFCPLGLLSIRPFVHQAFCPLGLLSIRPFVLRPFVLRPNVFRSWILAPSFVIVTWENYCPDFCSGDESATRTLLFDVMFCHEPRSHLVSLIILKAWPEVFTRRRFENGNCALDPLVDTVFWTIHNTGTAANMTTLSVSQAISI